MRKYDMLDLKKKDLVLLETRIMCYRQKDDNGRWSIHRAQFKLVAVSILQTAPDEFAATDENSDIDIEDLQIWILHVYASRFRISYWTPQSLMLYHVHGLDSLSKEIGTILEHVNLYWNVNHTLDVKDIKNTVFHHVPPILLCDQCSQIHR